MKKVSEESIQDTMKETLVERPALTTGQSLGRDTGQKQGEGGDGRGLDEQVYVVRAVSFITQVKNQTASLIYPQHLKVLCQSRPRDQSCSSSVEWLRVPRIELPFATSTEVGKGALQ